MNPAAIAVLKIALDDVKPRVTRRLEVPLSIQLDRLHLVIQVAMGWTDSHLYEIRAKDIGWGVPNPDFGGVVRDARKARLVDVLEDVGTNTLKYLYDFGDGWEHSIKIERLIDPVPGIAYPRLTKAAGRCPPEDVGGPWGYAEFLAALSDPGHECHAEFKELVPEDFDPNVIDADWLGEQVAHLAEHWSRKTAPKRPRGSLRGRRAS
ncbi:plasmid pRiA4b ORF-3 family protein [Verrucomicrobium sp. 3C]|uniref:plasmid pRiA4b ORF-3 family protein n=1 Tax=Verrucomicrobium sp. 3C TaxID=1134055 RepID=UPI00036BE0AD|nr:plasmid pRiA4b ORF-3 family protein [Verrucomicrobium sp. 3C]